VTDFEIGNGIIKIVASTTATVNDGRLDISWWTGASYAVTYGFEFYFDATRIPEFMYSAILTNTPQVCRLRIIRDAEDVNSIYRHVLDMEVQRGHAYASFVYTYSSGLGPTYIKVLQEGSGETLTAVTPTGASDHVGYESTNLWTMGSSRAVTSETGGMRITNYVGSYQRDFYIGLQLSGSAPDTVEDIGLQYHGPLSVVERAVRR
jgi:hypothetical protein